MFKSGGNCMAVGDRIKRARNLRGMTQKELGIAIGFEEKSADIRIAQYESNTRTPKEELLRKIDYVVLECNEQMVSQMGCNAPRWAAADREPADTNSNDIYDSLYTYLKSIE